MNLRCGKREGACAAAAVLLLGAALWRLSLTLSAAPGLLSASHIELGHGLLTAAHPSRLDPSFRLPLGPLLELSVERYPGAALVAAAAAAAALTAAAGALLAGTAAGLLAGALALFVIASLHATEGFFKMLFFTPLVLLPALALALRARRPGARADWLAGLAFAPALLYRSTLFLLPPIIAVWTLARGRDRKSALSAGRLLLPCALALLPWAWMNHRLHGSWTPFERGASDMLVVGGALGMVDTTPEGDRRLLAPGAPEGHGAVRWAAKKVLSAPAPYALAVVKRLRFAIGLAPWLVLFAALGFWRARRDPAARALALFAGYFIGVHVLLATLAYYYDPLWPALCALGAGLLAAKASPKDAERAAGRVLLAALVPALLLAAGAAAIALRYGLRAAATPPASVEAVRRALEARPDDERLRARRERLALAAAGDVAGLARHLQARARLGTEGRIEQLLALSAASARSGAALPPDRLLGEAAVLWRASQRLSVTRTPQEKEWEQSLKAGADESLGRRAQEVFEGFTPESWVPAFADAALLSVPRAARLPLLSLQAGAAARACPLFERLAEKSPSAQAWTDHGVCVYLAGRPKAAAASFRRAVALDPSFPGAAASLAVAERDMSRR